MGVLHAGASIAQTTATSLPIVGSDTSTIDLPPTLGKPNQSRVWYNRHRNRWDALVPRDDSLQNGGSISASDHYIVEDVRGSQTFTSVELEDRNSARPDAFWDDAAATLYVLGSHATTSRFWRVDYDPVSDGYAIDPAVDGVTVPGITHPDDNGGGNRPASLYVTPNGRVWVAVMKNGGLDVQQSSDGGASWLASAFRLDTSVVFGVTTWVHFTYLGTTFAGLFAAENGETLPGARFRFFSIGQDAEPTLLGSWTDESSSIPAPAGTEWADDHASAARDASENVYFAVKTEAGGPTDPRIEVFQRSAAGAWSRFLVTEAQDTPEQSRPSLVVDDRVGRLYVYTNDSDGGAGRRVVAGLESLGDLASAPSTQVFDGGPGAFSDLITPRHGVDALSGIAILAHNNSEQTLWVGIETPVAIPALPALALALLALLLVAVPLCQRRSRSRPGRWIP